MTDQDPSAMYGLEDSNSQGTSSALDNNSNTNLVDNVTPQTNTQFPTPTYLVPEHLGNRKRKSSADIDDDDDDDDGTQPVKKTAHNMIEKRYRTNLNDKIAALRDSVPSLRIMSKSARGEDTTEDREELHGLTPAHKLNKATVLSKATEYIRHLEKRNNRLLDENHAMQQRIAAFEKLFMAGYEAHTQAQMGQQPYPVPQQPYNPNPAAVRQQQIQQMQQMQQDRWRSSAPYLGKLMVGSLAGLM
ncbi:unnamed protein product [Parascedosporium putredinis]|uniref:BHLH domain-containing protein n=1 Tax=Parascedosporium putredinis TaxID=1442378 RepID=A0A9P1MEI9_9PEZI|nr:unnamed protein product [Parascedosporium putredinis]CAI8004733.1 unnamed protein product [Parascedosporium putredinis]